MIASIQGTLLSKGNGFVIVQVAGIGLRVHVPAFVLDKVYTPGQEVSLVTHFYVRENEMSLYGFFAKEELELFELLLQVAGIGPRVALNAMSFMAQETLRQVIADGDTAALSRIPGIGKKTAQRMVLDLREKVGLVTAETSGPWLGITAADAEVIAGLTSLGYSVAEAQEAVRTLPDAKLSLEEKLLTALQHLGGGES